VPSSAGPQPGVALQRVGKVQELAAGLCRRGVSEEKALREAAFAVFESAPDSLQDWVNRPGSDGGSDSRKDEDHASTEEVPAGVAGEGDAAGA